MKTAVPVLLALLLLVAPAVSQTPGDNLIVPGVRIGKWTLHMNIPDLERMNGPSSRRLLMRGHAPHADFIRDVTQHEWAFGLAALTFGDKRVELLKWYGGTKAVYKTKEGIYL